VTEDDEKRSNEASKKMWAMLADLSRQVPWPVFFEGRCDVVKLDADSWKCILTAGLAKSQRMAQGIEGGYVLLGESTRKMGKKKMAMLLDLIKLFGDSKQVRWSASEEMEEQYREDQR
jgi:hypothetical protein